jgi:alpha/beta superfamily hydrolase
MKKSKKGKNKSIGKKLLKALGFVALGLLVIVVILNIYGRSHFDPKGSTSEEEISNPELVSGKNTIEFLSEGDKISAFLFIPDDFVEGEKRPSIVIVPPHSGVKEQTAGIYAEKLSEKGFVTLAFDPRGFGESGGHPVLLNSFRQAEDVRNAIDYIETLEQVDTNNIFNMGMCAGSGVSIYETISDPRIKAQAIVSPYLTGPENVTGDSFFNRNLFYTFVGIGKLGYKFTGNDITVQMVPLTMEEANEGLIPPTPIVLGMMEYYIPGAPGNVPTWRNAASLMSFAPVIDFSIYDYADDLEVPIYMVYGSEAVSKDGPERLYDQLTGTKDRLIIEGAGHFDLYWMPEYVNPAVGGLTEFFNQYINE